jgi:hypothetical protein
MSPDCDENVGRPLLWPPLVYDADPRRAWRQWCVASAQWPARWEHFLTHRPPRPLGLVVGQRRRLTRALMTRHAAAQAVLAQRPVFPEQCRDLTCGAKTRQGTPCQRRDLYGPRARCRLHGGLSTGPTTPEGKQRSAANGVCPKRKRTP